uniref:Uncharacterized protein n=1 Tax=Eptatretus burgeri TaxID=7764 RepID=A0A8C4QD47_EPTBU
MEQGASSGLVDSIKDLHEIKPQVLIHFLPTLLNQLLRLLTLSIHEDVSINTARLLVHIIDQCQKESCMMYLHSYVKRIFKIEVRDQATDRTTHEALAKALVILLDPTFDSSFVEKLLKHLWFFYELIHKSMVQYLVQTGLDSVPRGQRFPASVHEALKAGISNAAQRVIQRQREGPEEARLANRSVATFLTHCFSLMDRGFVFCLFNNYANTFSHPDNKTLMEMKFEVLQTLGNYEHFVPLNLPLLPMPKEQAMAQNTCWHMRVNEAFCRRHFPVGLILRELGVALCEGSTELRHPAISTLRGLITKHALDTRYAGQDRQKRVATLYLPLLSLIQECAHSIISMSVGLQQDNLNCKEEILPAGPPRSAGLGLELPAFSFQAGGTLRSSESRISVTSIDSVGSVAERRSTMDCSSLVLQQEKLTKSEVRSLLLVFLHILKHIPPDALLAYWKQLSPANIPGFFSLLEMCVKHFKYCGKNHHGTSTASDQTHHQRSRSHTAALVRRSQTLPTRRSAHGIPRTARVRSHDGVEVSEALLAAHLSTEVCLTILDVLDLFTTHHKEQLLIDQGDNALMRNVFGVYLAFLQIGQSLAAQAHIFAAFHLFLNQFKLAFFRGRAAMCEALCMEVLRCSCSRLSDVRSHACLLLHLLMRLDFELTGRTGLSRTHTQIVVAVSRLIADMPELGEGGG